MLSFSEVEFSQLCIHHVGNKQQDGRLILSERPVTLTDEVLPQLLMRYFLSPFAHVQEVYRFYHPNGTLSLNEVYHFTESFFESSGDDLHGWSKQICKHLFESSNHPKIKGGEVYIVHLSGMEMEGERCDAIGIFKSENKEAYLKVFPEEGNFVLEYEQEAININKLDKGCLIINSEKEKGYKVLVVDQTNRQEAAYWKDDFLQIRIRNDAFNQTGNFLNVYKQFVHNELDEFFEMERPDKIDLLNRSIGYFQEKETFRQQEFEEEVIGNSEAADRFRDFRKQFETDHDALISDEFSISDQAVRKVKSTYKSVLKLDKNFHIYVHGKREYIERGFDEEKGLNFYKVYFKEES